jgi:hypothetical protein
LKDSATVTSKEITQEELHSSERPVKKFVLWFMVTPRGVILTRPLALQLIEIPKAVQVSLKYHDLP